MTKERTVETWVIIVKLTHGVTIKKENPVLGRWGMPIITKHGTEEKEVTRFKIDSPMIIVPSGNGIENIEIIPITRPLVLHTENIRRRLNPS